MPHGYKIETNIRGNMTGKIPWHRLRGEGDVLIIHGDPKFDRSIRASAGQFVRDRKFKISIKQTEGGWKCTWMPVDYDRTSPYASMLTLEVGQVLNFKWTWLGWGETPPEYRTMRSYYYKAWLARLELHWEVWRDCGGVTIKRMR